MAVSHHIGAMRVLWLAVPDPATRADVGQNSIALTSRLADGQDQPSPAGSGTTPSPARSASQDCGTSNTSAPFPGVTVRPLAAGEAG
jgi:hypothetical protein